MTLAVLRDHALRALRATTFATTRLDLSGLNVFGLHLFRFLTQRKKCKIDLFGNIVRGPSNSLCDDPEIGSEVVLCKISLRNRTLSRGAPRRTPRIPHLEFFCRVRKSNDEKCMTTQQFFRTKRKADISRSCNVSAHKGSLDSNSDDDRIPSTQPLF